MRGLFRIAIVLSGFALLTGAIIPAANALSPEDRSPIVVVYKDGHHQSFAAGEIVRLDMKPPVTIVYKDGHREKLRADIDHIEFDESSASVAVPGRTHYIGKWEVGEGNGNHFFITLEANGDAKKSIGSPHGTWTLVDGEAHIAWDDGWHDAIRKRGGRHEKAAFEPGKGFDDSPSNVTEARNTQPKPI